MCGLVERSESLSRLQACRFIGLFTAVGPTSTTGHGCRPYVTSTGHLPRWILAGGFCPVSGRNSPSRIATQLARYQGVPFFQVAWTVLRLLALERCVRLSFVPLRRTSRSRPCRPTSRLRFWPPPLDFRSVDRRLVPNGWPSQRLPGNSYLSRYLASLVAVIVVAPSLVQHAPPSDSDIA